MRNLAKIKIIFLVTLVLISKNLVVGNTIQATHVGSVDPTSEGWILSQTGIVTNSGGVDAGTNQWTIDTGPGSFSVYSFNLPQNPYRWSATGTLKAVRNADERFPNDIILEVDDSESRWQLNFVTSDLAGSPGLYFATSVSGTSLIQTLPDIDSTYHTYEIRLLRGSAGGLANPNLNSDDLVEVYLNTSLVATLSRAEALLPALVGGIAVRWGDGGSVIGNNASPSAESRWSFVEFATFSEPIPGDYDQDSDVDGADFLDWQREFGMTGQDLAADGNDNGTVDAADLVIWQDNFGAGVSAASALATVPEPTSIGLSVLGIIALSVFGFERSRYNSRLR